MKTNLFVFSLLVFTIVFCQGQTYQNELQLLRHCIKTIPLLNEAKQLSNKFFLSSLPKGGKIEERIIESKEFMDFKGGHLKVKQLQTKAGLYKTLAGLKSSIFFDDSNEIVVVLISDSTEIESYFATIADVIGNIEKMKKKAIYSLQHITMGTFTFAETHLQKGHYQAFNGKNSAFIYNEKELVAILTVQQKEKSNLYIATEATCDFYQWPGEPGENDQAIFQPNMKFKALIGSELGVIFDRNGDPHIIRLSN